ncbi:type VI secretion protein, EvpB/ family [Piscirickettsia salmonis]|uniref:Intracellular growth locus IglB n=1 Tax=Piscirickettsia salmonis TaxID=1238 RepID=A0A1L6TCE9_PISSA|nr:type VI secretion system contractile sheath large subunit [Piscirickettsia salmonis]AKP74093.1 intracellular growth locus iglB [Piscirickettsia salmonis LF-89 = ATCC VR-1361]ALB22964.1 intracellular growth locus IglB [Piscirickettsia salmonis]AMA42470.1 intracellular growth locus iglB [Piscirickettsia salmonis]AOS34940.1 intracellular growth locus iglB [Piscirickettsia salmonis]APS59649.1 intracellular growth locus iglB [Piscirickettsia salmonis]
MSLETQVQQETNINTLFSTLNLSETLYNSESLSEGETFEVVGKDYSDEERLVASLCLLLANTENLESFNKGLIQNILDKIDHLISEQVNEVLSDQKFKTLESTWLAIDDLVKDTNFQANIKIDLLDVTKEELEEDFDCNSIDITGADLFKKVYLKEYDQFGGEPYGTMIGLYEFSRSPEDIAWLSAMGKVATVSHAPFVSSASPQLFDCNTVEELSLITDLEGLTSHPKFGAWNKFRKTEQATYIGLTLPRYLLRVPYDPLVNPVGKALKTFKEEMNYFDDQQYAWGNSAILFAKNLTQAFALNGWCQQIRGPKGGGLLEGLATPTFNVRGKEEIKAPVEFMIPDYRELEFSNAGFMPLVYEKGSSNACFFSTESLKFVEEFEDPHDSENSQMIANLAYTYSICRIAHYVRTMMRADIGTTAGAEYIQQKLEGWVSNYVTLISNPDDLTVSFFPFKKAEIKVEKIDGKAGWYTCNITVLPHIQFEGLDVELKIDTRLDS